MKSSSDKVYVLTSYDYYDSWDIAYFKTAKAAYRRMIEIMYNEWMQFRYISPDRYGFCDYRVKEYDLND